MTYSMRLQRFRADNGAELSAGQRAALAGGPRRHFADGLDAVSAHKAAPARTAHKPATPTKPATPAPQAAATPALTQIDVTIATNAARSRERERVTAVLASPAAKGREGVCATLLAASRGWSAQQIIAQLPHLSTDAQRAADAAASDCRAKAGRILSDHRAATGAKLTGQSVASVAERAVSKAEPKSTLTSKARAILSDQRAVFNIARN
jgi:hypothetical protein